MSVKFSIICVAYNHENYIGHLIDSVLSQTFQDFELLVIDDCSPDKTVEIAKQYNNEKIKVFTKEFNRGINDSINIGLENAQGKYCILMGSDDMLDENFLENINNIFEKNPDKDIVYSALKYIDKDNNVQLVDGKEKIFSLPKLNRQEYLNKLFLEGNILVSPGMAVRAETFKSIYPLDCSFMNMQDYYVHILLLLKHEFFLSDLPLVLYRYTPTGSSISSRNLNTENREKFETPNLMNAFLSIDDVETLKKIFPNSTQKFEYSELIPYYLGKEALMNSPHYEKKLWGYNTIMKFIGNRKNINLLHEKENFNFAQYLGLIKNVKPNPTKLKLAKYKKIYRYLLTSFITVSVLLLISIIANILLFIK